MPKITIPITEGFYESFSLPVSAQECVNWYPSAVQTSSVSNSVLFGTPGTRQIADAGGLNFFNRGIHVKDDIPFLVCGQSLYKLVRTFDSGGEPIYSLVFIGTIDGTNRVSMADNGKQLVILSPGGKGYIYDETLQTPLQEISDPGFRANGNPQNLVFLDGYFVFGTDEKKIIVSALNDGSSYNALDFGSAESDPDKIVGIVTLNNQLFVLGTLTTEVFRNIGGAGFPLQRVNGYFFDKGCTSLNSIIKGSSSFMMLGRGEKEDDVIWLFSGNGYQKISTPGIDSIIRTKTDSEKANSFGWYYSDTNSYFMGLTIGNTTLVYDLSTQRWHRRSSIVNNVESKYRISDVVRAYGEVIVGDTEGGRVGVLDRDTYKEYDENIRRVVASPNLSLQLNNTKVSLIEATLESGVGNSEDSDPHMEMSYSDNGGKTFVYPRKRSMGKIGEYERRVIWRRNGAFPRFRIIRLSMSDKVKPVLISLTADVSQ